MMRIFTGTLLITISLSTIAQALCSKLPEPISVTTILEKVISPVYSTSFNTKEQFKTVNGCLLQAEGRILGYTNNPHICKLEPGFEGTFIIKKDCCDYLGMPPCDASAEPNSHAQTLQAEGRFVDLVIIDD